MPRPAERGGASRHLLRVAGVLLGAGLVLLALPSLTPAAGPPELPLTVDASVLRSGEVGVDGAEQLLSSAEVRPTAQGAALARTDLVSQTALPVDVSVQEVGPPTGWEEHLWLRIALGDVVVFDGPRTGLRPAPSVPVRLAPGMHLPLAVSVSLAPGAPDVHQGRRMELRFQLTSIPVRPGGG